MQVNIKIKKYRKYRKLIIVILLFVQINYVLFAKEFSSKLCVEAEILAKSGKYVEAEKKYLESINLNNYYHRAHYGYGKLCLYIGKIDLAVKHLENAVRLDKSHGASYFYLGMAYFFKKKYNLAIKYLLKSYEIDTDFVETLYNVGVIFELIGDEYKSKKYFIKYFNEKQKEETGILF